MLLMHGANMKKKNGIKFDKLLFYPPSHKNVINRSDLYLVLVTIQRTFHPKIYIEN